MRKFILATLLALTVLGTSISTAEAQLFQRGSGTLFQNAYNRAPYYNMNSTPGPYFGSGRYNSSYFNNPYTSAYYVAPYYGSPSTYYNNQTIPMPQLSNTYNYAPTYPAYWNAPRR